jgi:hypothetical protein
MKIILNNKSYSLKFGLGFFRVLGRVYGDTTLNQTLARLTVLDEIKEDIPFDFMDLIENLIIAAAINGGNEIEEEVLSEKIILDVVFQDVSILQQIVTGIVQSMPKQNDNQGKQIAPRKRSAKS